MYKKAMLLTLLGYACGCLIGLLFSLGGGHDFGEALPNILLGGIPGAIAMGTTVVYDIEKWSILRATVTHFLIVMGVNLLACFVLKWFEPWSTAFWIMIAGELIGYICIWLICYRSYSRTVRRMNSDLKKWKSAQKPE